MTCLKSMCVLCDEKLMGDTLFGWCNTITHQKQNTTKLSTIDGDQKRYMGCFHFCSLFGFLQVMNPMGFYYQQCSLCLCFFFEWIFYGVLLLRGGFCWMLIKGMNALSWELFSFNRGYAKFHCAMCLLGKV